MIKEREKQGKNHRKKQRGLIGLFILILVLLIINIFSIFSINNPDIELFKKMIGVMIIAVILYKLNLALILFGGKNEDIITKHFFGVNKKDIDILILFSYFSLFLKDIIYFFTIPLKDFNLTRPFIEFIFNNRYLIQQISFIAGGLSVIIISLYLAVYCKIDKDSFLSLIHKKGIKNDNGFNNKNEINRNKVNKNKVNKNKNNNQNIDLTSIVKRFFSIYFILIAFFLIVFNFIMKWLVILIEIPLLLTLVSLFSIIMLFYHLLIYKYKIKVNKSAKKNMLARFIFNLFFNLSVHIKDFFNQLVSLFKDKRRLHLAISILILVHIFTDMIIFIIPYTAGSADILYFNSLDPETHQPLANLFIEDISDFAGNNLDTISIIAGYLFNIYALLILVLSPFILWYKLFKKRNLSINPLVLSLFLASLFVLVLNPIFSIGFFDINNGIVGVDLMTNNIADNGSIDLPLTIILALLICTSVYFLLKNRTIDKTMIGVSLFIIDFVIGLYIFFYFSSVIAVFPRTFFLLFSQGNYWNYFISFHFLLFLIILLIFYLSSYFLYIYETSLEYKHIHLKNI
ncbi:MAG: hypothetical protein V1740_04390 [Candidatus Woesearchaeota archaeon]